MKAVMPKLGQKTETPRGPGTVVSLQLLKSLVTVLIDGENQEETFPARELGFGDAPAAPIRLERKPKDLPGDVATELEAIDVENVDVAAPAEVAAGAEAPARSGRKRRRRRNRGHSSQSTSQESQPSA
jgi:hypothetical protein